jgi:hypothetical protein
MGSVSTRLPAVTTCSRLSCRLGGGVPLFCARHPGQQPDRCLLHAALRGVHQVHLSSPIQPNGCRSLGVENGWRPRLQLQTSVHWEVSRRHAYLPAARHISVEKSAGPESAGVTLCLGRNAEELLQVLAGYEPAPANFEVRQVAASHLVIEQVTRQPSQTSGLIDRVRQPFSGWIRCRMAWHAAAGIRWFRDTFVTQVRCGHSPASGRRGWLHLLGCWSSREPRVLV